MTLDELIAELQKIRGNDPERGMLPVYMDGRFCVSEVIIETNKPTGVEMAVNII